MICRILVVLLLVVAKLEGSLAIKVVMLPNFGRSHYIVMAKLAQELDGRGHKVTIIVGAEADYATGRPHVKAFDMDEASRNHINRHAQDSSALAKLSPLGRLKGTATAITNIQTLYCDLTLSDSVLMNEIQHADVLIGDSMYLCSALIADKFDLAHVVIVMSPLGTPMLQAYGITHFPAYTPMMVSGLPADMGLGERIQNFVMYLAIKALLNFYVVPYSLGNLKEKHGISPEKSTKESLLTVDLLLLTKPLVLDHAQPLPPYAREVGNFMPSPARPLPSELEAFMQSSGDEGVIIISFGSMIDTFDDHVVQRMIGAFSRLPYKVLWRLKPGNMESSLGPNIKAVKWLPQNDVLGHNRTQLFIMHGGANGLAEAAYHGVPVVCSPFFGDQFDNAQVVLHAGIGETLDVSKATTEEMFAAVKKVLTEPKYKTNAARVSRVIKLLPRPPLQEAADLVEYVQAQGHLGHLKPRSLFLPFYQVYMLDVLAVMATAMVIVLVLVVSVARLVIRSCSLKKDKIA